MGTDDGELVRQTMCGDRRVFAELVDRYRDSVYGLAFHYLGNREDAQDAAQEAFVQAYQHLSQLREPDKFAAWLRRLTFNGCTDYRRRHDRPLRLDDEINYQTVSTDPGVDRLITRLAVQEALARLPERTRLTVILCHLEGYSHEEASQFLSIPINTVRSRLQHAKRQLREEMRDMVSEEVNAGRPDADWTRQVVQEAMTRGQQAREDYKKREAIGHYDAALGAISTLPPGKEQARLRMDALWQKGSTLDEQRSGSTESIALLEQSLDLAEELKDRRGQMEKRIELGRAFYNSGQDESALENYREAQKIAQELGDTHTQARCLTSQGIGRLWGTVRRAWLSSRRRCHCLRHLGT